MNNKIIAALAVAVVAIVAFLFFNVFGEDEPGERIAQTSTAKSTKTANTSSPALPPTPLSPDRPAVQSDERSERPKGQKAYKEYYLDDGTLVRDHRKNAPEIDPSKMVMPNTSDKKIKPTVVAALRLSLKPKVDECRKNYASDIGDGARLQIVAKMSSLAGVVTVNDVSVKTREVEGDGLQECVRIAWQGSELAAEGHEDVERYTLTYPIDL